MRGIYFYTVSLLVATSVLTESKVIYNNGLTPLANFMGLTNSPFVDAIRRRCPLCDTSVYPYCSDKLLHDSCCCPNHNNPYDRLPYECHYADCSFLHSNSCQEHHLISSCCCTNLYIHKK